MTARQRARQMIESVFASYSVPYRVSETASTAERVKFVRGIYNIMVAEGVETPKNFRDEDAYELSFNTKYTIYKSIKSIMFDEMHEQVRSRIEFEKKQQYKEMLQKYGTVDNFPLANYYTERFDNDRVCNFLPFKLMEMNCEKKPKLIIDCGYEGQDLTMKKLLYAQFNQVYSHVKKAHSLLPIGFSSTKSALRLPDPIINLNGSGLISITDQDFSTLCEDYKEIVYLSPHSDRVLHEINSNTAYIIGGLVDIHQNLPYSIARARKFKVKTAALPLDIYFNWEKGSKSLTIDQMIKIMYTLWETGSWYDALSFVPQRKATPTRALLDLKNKAKTETPGSYQSGFFNMGHYGEREDNFRRGYNRKPLKFQQCQPLQYKQRSQFSS